MNLVPRTKKKEKLMVDTWIIAIILGSDNRNHTCMTVSSDISLPKIYYKNKETLEN